MATTNTLRLKVGGKYKTRDGRVAVVDGPNDTDREFVIEGTVEGVREVWRSDGTWHWNPGSTSDLDLVSEIQDEASAYRYFCYKDRESNFSGQNMRWRVLPGGRPEACDIRDGIWRVSAHTDEASLGESTELVECDADGNPLEPAAPEYRYFADRDEAYNLRTTWRVSPDGKVEAKHYGKDGDPWEVCWASHPSEFAAGEFFECDVDRNPLQTPEPTSHDDLAIVSFKTTEDLTPEQRTRIAKLAARIVLADGPVLTVDELAGLTVGELVARLEDTTDIYSI